MRIFTAPLTAFMLGTFMVPEGASAEKPTATKEDKAEGLKIAKTYDKRNQGFKDEVATLKMTLTNANGESTERAMRMWTYEVIDDKRGDKSILVFDTPRDVKGTALLSHAHHVDPDDQWLFLPALKRIKRIASANKSGPFVGSEFAYEDITSSDIEKFDWYYLRTENLDGQECYVLKRIPLYENSGYTKQISWIDTKHYRLQKVDYYDRKDSLLKTLRMKGYKLYKDKFWRAETWEMTNHQSKKSTVLAYTSRELSTGLEEDEFTKGRLKSYGRG